MKVKTLTNLTSRYPNTSKIILGDTLTHLKELESESFDLVITSPPYNIGKEYEAKQSVEDYLAFQEQVVYELVRLVNLHGSICWQVGNYVSKGEIFPLDIFYYPIFKKLDLKLRNRIIWHFGHGLHARNRFSGRYETLLWFTKTDDYIFNLDPVRIPSKYPNKRHFKGPKKGQISGNPKGKNPSDIWEIILQDWEKGLWNIPNIKSNHPEKNYSSSPISSRANRTLYFSTYKSEWLGFRSLCRSRIDSYCCFEKSA